MKNISTGFGLCVAAVAALAYPFVSSLAPNANASAVTAAASAVSTAATGQVEPTIVWFGVTGNTVWRAWNTGRLKPIPATSISRSARVPATPRGIRLLAAGS
jgi:hypothetical protein